MATGGTPNVAFRRKELEEKLPEYEVIRDCLAGSATIKKKRIKYLPMPNAHDQSPENMARYGAYLRRAVFYNVTRRTARGLNGQMFMRAPVIEVPPALDAVVEDVDGEGVSLTQLAQWIGTLAVSYGRAGLYVDYPDTSGIVTLADMEDKGIRPTIKGYDPFQIINWRTRARGAKSVLSLVVLEEPYAVKDDGYEVEYDTQWRVLRLSDDDVYHVEIWRKVGAENRSFFRASAYQPLKADGQPFNDIPFCFVGSENNDSDVDEPPLYDMADLNVAHYRNSADYEEASYIAGQPTPIITGLTETWVDKYFKNGVGLGSRAAIPLPAGASADLLQAEPNNMPFAAMEHKERQMVSLGAKLVEQKKVQRTATEAGIEEAAESSTLATIAGNVSLAFVWALGWAAWYIGVPETGIKFEVNKDFDLAKMSPEERKQLIQEWQNEAITFSEMRAGLRRSGVATLTDAEAEKEIRDAIPLPTQTENNPEPEPGEDE